MRSCTTKRSAVLIFRRMLASHGRELTSAQGAGTNLRDRSRPANGGGRSSTAGDDLPQQQRELEPRLAEGIRRSALTQEQVRALPDTYTVGVAAQHFAAAYNPRKPQQPYVPPELFRSGGPWVCLSAYLGSPGRVRRSFFLKG